MTEENIDNVFKPEAHVLSDLLTTQLVITTLSDQAAIADFVVNALLEVPGVLACRACLLGCCSSAGDFNDDYCENCPGVNGESVLLNENFETNCHYFKKDNIKIFRLSTTGYKYGYLLFRIDDWEKFSVYKTYLVNYANFISITLENHYQKKLLHQTHNRLSSVFDAIDEGIWDWNILTGEVSFNTKWPSIFGYAPDEIEKHVTTWEEALHPDDKNRVMDTVKAHLEGRTTHYHSEHRMKNKEGEWLWILDRGKVIEWDKDGNPSRMVGADLDITERKNSVDMLRLSEERFRSAFDNIAVGNIVTNENGIIERTNKAAQEIFGHSADEIINHDVHMLMPESDPENNNDDELCNIDLSDLGGSSKEITGIRKNGEKFPMHVSLGEMMLGDNKFLIYSITDLTALKNLEYQLFQSQKMEAIGQLTGGVAHDFNNLLAIMIGNTELLAGKIGPDEKKQRHIQNMVRAIDRAASLTNRLLAFSRRQPLAPEITNIAKIVTNLEDMLHRTLGETVKLRVKNSPDLWTATVDPHQIDNAILNLTINARDAMPEGGELIIETSNAALDETYAQQQEEVIPGNYVKITITDTGTGMSSEVQKKMFDPFFTTKKFGAGSGLGLSMVYGFVKQSGGHISISSKEGKGTVVSLYLTAIPKEPEEQEVENPPPISVTEKMNVLLVEDDAEVREVTADMLKHLSFGVVEAEDGPSALKVLDEISDAIDFVISDVTMPNNMSGIELTEVIRSKYKDIKVLLTSGYPEKITDEDEFKSLGIELLTKPYKLSQLIAAIEGITLQSLD